MLSGKRHRINTIKNFYEAQAFAVFSLDGSRLTDDPPHPFPHGLFGCKIIGQPQRSLDNFFFL